MVDGIERRRRLIQVNGKETPKKQKTEIQR
jgi:hypothetical protein